MKIAHLIFSLRTGGTENMLIDIINQQVLHADVSLYIINNDINKNLLTNLDKRAKVIEYERTPGSKNPLIPLLLNVQLLIGNYDIVHCHNHNMISILLRFFHKKTILTIHTTDIKSTFFNKYARCFAISKAVQADLSRRNVKSTIIQNGILFNSIRSRTNSDKLEENTVFKIVQIGRLDYHIKGQDILIKAIAKIKNMGISQIQLDFIGEGEYDYLKDLCNKLKLNEFVNFLGLRDRNYIYENLYKYDLLVQPSLYEGFGLTIVEGIAAKVPVLVSNIEAPMAIILNGKYGYYFEKGNVSDLADKIIEIINEDNEKIKDRSNEAFLFAKSEYGINSTVSNYLKEYRLD